MRTIEVARIVAASTAALSLAWTSAHPCAADASTTRIASIAFAEPSS